MTQFHFRCPRCDHVTSLGADEYGDEGAPSCWICNESMVHYTPAPHGNFIQFLIDTEQAMRNAWEQDYGGRLLSTEETSNLRKLIREFFEDKQR